MKPEEDAYGQELWAHYNNARSYEIIERDDGYFDVSSGAPAYFSTYEKWPPQEQAAMKFAHGRVLDVGCGAGRHSLYLQGVGLNVLGIDISPLAIQVCKLRGLWQAEVIPIEGVDSISGPFDTILMMCNNFGLFASFSKARELLKEFYAKTSPDCHIIAESNDPYQTNHPRHLEYHALNHSRGRSPGQIRIRVRFGKFATPWFDYLLVSKSEMEEILKGTRWVVRQFLDSGKSSYIAIIKKK